MRRSSLREAEQPRGVAHPHEALVDGDAPAAAVVRHRGIGQVLVREEETVREDLGRVATVTANAEDLPARAARPVHVRRVECEGAAVEQRRVASDLGAGRGGVEREGADALGPFDDEEPSRVGDETDERADRADRDVVGVRDAAPADEIEERRVRAARAQAVLRREDEVLTGGREVRHGALRVAVANRQRAVLLGRVGDVERAGAARRRPEELRAERDDAGRVVDEAPGPHDARGAAVRGGDGERVDGVHDEEVVGGAEGARAAGEDRRGDRRNGGALGDPDERGARRHEHVRLRQHEVPGDGGDELAHARWGTGCIGLGGGIGRVRGLGGSRRIEGAVALFIGRGVARHPADGIGAPREDEEREQGEDGSAEHGGAWHEATADATDVPSVTFPHRLRGPLRLRGALLGGRYELLDLLGAGGAGAVYEAIDRVTDRLRAVKVALATGDEEMRARFAREAKIAGRAESPFLVEIVDYGHDEEQNVDFLVMERLRGADLGSVLRERRRFERGEARTILDQVARGLSCLHAEGIVHRDVKPENVFVLDEGGAREVHVKLLDLGIAKRFDVEAAQTTAAVGTPAFMAPEQLRGDAAVDALCDVYAYGQLAYVLLVGAPYFLRELRAAANLHEYRVGIEGRTPRLASTRAKDDGVVLPEGFDAWFARATAPDPLDRFPDLEAARAACLAILGAPEAHVAPAPVVRAARAATATVAPSPSRRPWRAGGVVLAAGIVAVAGLAVRAGTAKGPRADVGYAGASASAPEAVATVSAPPSSAASVAPEASGTRAPVSSLSAAPRRAPSAAPKAAPPRPAHDPLDSL